MANIVDKIRVQQALVALVKNGTYYPVTYDKNTRQPLDIDATSEKVSPASVHANEVSAEFSQDTRQGRRRCFQRTEWSWIVSARFQGEVTVQVAEDAWLSPSVLLRDTNIKNQVELQLAGSSYFHPTQQGSHGGTHVEFIFKARQSRR